MSMISNCDTCKASQPVSVRASIGCGYEREVERSIAWSHRSGKCAPATCAGYLVRLPEVIEAARARLHWSKGSLRDFCASQPSENILLAVEIVESAAGEVESYVMSERR